MSALSLINNFSLDTLKYLDAEILAMPGTLEKLDELANDGQFDLEPGSAFEFHEKLDKLIKNNLNYVKTNPEAYNQLMVILWKLFWKSLPAMPAKMRTNILSENLIDTLKLGINVLGCLEKIIGIFEFRMEPAQEIRRDWIYSLEHNQEKLSTKMLEVDGNSMQPSIENWLKSYNIIQPLTGQRVRFNQISYLNLSKEAGALSENDKEVLKQILEIYDWLLFPPSEPQVVPDEGAAGSIPFLTKDRFHLPKEILGSSTKLMPPVVPAPKNMPELKPIQEIQQARAGGSADSKPKEKLDFGAGKDNGKSLISIPLSLTAQGNKKTGPFGTASGLKSGTESPNLTLNNTISDIHSNNQKPAEAGNLVSSNLVRELDLSSRNRLSQARNNGKADILKKPEEPRIGAEGLSVTKNSDFVKVVGPSKITAPNSAPDRTEEVFHPGLRMGGLGGQGDKSLIINPLSLKVKQNGQGQSAEQSAPINNSRPISQAKGTGDNGDVYIDRKLEELEKRLDKPNP